MLVRNRFGGLCWDGLEVKTSGDGKSPSCKRNTRAESSDVGME